MKSGIMEHEASAATDLPVVAGKVRRDVLRHRVLPGRFRVKQFPARESLPDCALMEIEHAPGKWREHSIMGVDEFIAALVGGFPSASAGKGNYESNA